MEVWKIIFLLVLVMESGKAQLSENFYRQTCPSLEKVVRQAVTIRFRHTFATAPATLHLFFKDCFVQGCDASLMISLGNGDVEKDDLQSISVAGRDGFETVIKAKQAVEKVCPGVVSCADILALATRDVVVLTGGPSFKVELGRRDGVKSKASNISEYLPKPTFDLNQLLSLFAKHNLTQTDMIALSGAHTIGTSHCSKFANRIYNFSSSKSIDPTLNPEYAQHLQQQCPPNPDPNHVVFIDPSSPFRFDNLYYKDLIAGKGLFSSDQVLFTNSAARKIVFDFATNAAHFAAAFVTAMRKLGRIGVKTGNQGEVRNICQSFNS